MAAGRLTACFAATLVFAAMPCLSAPWPQPPPHPRPAAAGKSATPPSASAQPPTRDKQTIWSYEGGVLLETDGTLPNGICFRVKGRITSEHFFDELKRIDKIDAETVFQRGEQTVTEFPETLLLEFAMHDLPCTASLKPDGQRVYLTRAMVSEFRLSLFWKHGVELRPLTGFKPLEVIVRPVAPYNPEAKDLPEKFIWFYSLSIPSAGVPLTDSLVMIIRAEDGRVAARVAARL